MGACYGDGLLGFVREPVEGQDAEIAYIEGFAALGLSHKFREIINGRVLELAYKKGGKVETRWLSEEEAAPVIAAEKKIGGSAPYRMFPECLNEQIYIPGCRTGVQEKLPGRVVRSMVGVLHPCVMRLQDSKNGLNTPRNAKFKGIPISCASCSKTWNWPANND